MNTVYVKIPTDVIQHFKPITSLIIEVELVCRGATFITVCDFNTKRLFAVDKIFENKEDAIKFYKTENNKQQMELQSELAKLKFFNELIR